MPNRPSSAQRAKLMAMLQFAVPVTTLIMAVMCWLIMPEDLKPYVCAGLVVLAAIEFFTLRAFASKLGRQAERDRG